MKTEQALRKYPVEPLAVMPDSQLTGIAAAALRRAGAHSPVRRLSPAMVAPGVYADLIPSVYGALILSWVCFMAISWVTFAASPPTLFLLLVIAVYALMFFGVPIAINRWAAKQLWSDPGLSTFVRAKVDTIYGPVSGLEALIQVILIPVCLTIGGIGIAFAIEAARSAY